MFLGGFMTDIYVDIFVVLFSAFCLLCLFRPVSCVFRSFVVLELCLALCM